MGMTIEQLAEAMNQGFAGIGVRLDKMDERLDKMEQRLQSVEDIAAQMIPKIHDLKVGQVTMQKDLTELKETTARIEKRLDGVERVTMKNTYDIALATTPAPPLFVCETKKELE